MNRVGLALRYALGTRPREYRKILEAALAGGYRVCSVEQSVKEIECGTERLLVLRHDVDQISPGVSALASIEAALGISASYYFRIVTLNRADVEYVRRLGHEISLHYETIADYSLEHGIVDGATIRSTEALEECAERLARDLQWFRSEVGASCRTLASHGATRNRELGVPNRILFETIENLHGRLGVIVEAYDSDYLREFDCYISDTQLEINDGFRYNTHPLQAIMKSTRRIMVLTHPNHWAFSPATRFRRIIKCLIVGSCADPSPFAEAHRLRSAART